MNIFRNFQPPEGVVDNNLSSDRVIGLKPIDGLKPKSSTGLVDPRLFKGENSLHLCMNLENSLWYFRYAQGNIPGALDQHFTTVEKALEYAKTYFRERNLEIVEIQE